MVVGNLVGLNADGFAHRFEFQNRDLLAPAFRGKSRQEESDKEKGRRMPKGRMICFPFIGRNFIGR